MLTLCIPPMPHAHGLCWSCGQPPKVMPSVATPTSRPPRAIVWNVASTPAASRSTSTPRRCWCADRQSWATATVCSRLTAWRPCLTATWATPSSDEAVLSWLCLTAAIRPKTASPTAGVRKRIFATRASDFRRACFGRSSSLWPASSWTFSCGGSFYGLKNVCQWCSSSRPCLITPL